MGELPDQLAQGFVHQELLMTLVFLCVFNASSFILAGICLHHRSSQKRQSCARAGVLACLPPRPERARQLSGPIAQE
jgi:hypothetical protein